MGLLSTLALAAVFAPAPEAAPAPAPAPTPDAASTPDAAPTSDPAPALEAAQPTDAAPTPTPEAAPAPAPAPEAAPVPAPEAAPTPTPTPEAAPAPEAAPTPAPASAPPPSTETNPPPPSSPGARPKKQRPDRPRFPRLVIAGGPMIGPHAIGNQECRAEDRRCVTAGGFFGVGLQAEIRARIWKPLYAHARGVFAGNVAPKENDPIYTGVGAFGIGMGVYGRRIFARAEYMLVDAFGKDTFTPPFHTSETGKDVWGHHAGLVSVGFRQPIGQRLAIELWGGPMIGPKSVRTIPPVPPERRILPTFLLGINLAFDALP